MSELVLALKELLPERMDLTDAIFRLKQAFPPTRKELKVSLFR
jgi:hypothetical protein